MVTMRDVAREAGVSQSTVSYALNGDPSIPSSTRSRIVKTAEKIGYHTNISARSLRTGKTGAIGLIVQDLTNPYYTQIANTISKTALLQNEQTVIQQTIYEEENETSILGHIVNSFCDAVIFSPTRLTSQEIVTQLDGKPALLLSPTGGFDDIQLIARTTQESVRVDVLSVETCNGLREITNYVLDHGCHRPLFIGRPWQPLKKIMSSTDSAWERAVGFQQALLDHGIQPSPANFFNPAHWELSAVKQEVGALLASFADPEHPPFDACICVNDETALGTLLALQERGIDVPKTVCVTGFDGIEEGQLVYPGITTEAIDFSHFAEVAVKAVMSRIHHTGSVPLPPQLFTITPHLITRGTTR